MILTIFCAAALAAGNTIVADDAYKRVYEADMASDAAWAACRTPAELTAHQARLKAALLASLGGFPARTPLNPVVTGRIAREGYVVEKVMFESRPHHHVTANLFLPDPTRFSGRRPGIIVPCGHSYNGKACTPYQRGAVKAALRGMVAMVYDPIDQGERRQSRGNDNMCCYAHNSVGMRAELLGQSTATYRIWDGMRALDYLETRSEVDASRLGVMGHSGGGTMTSWIMCLDDRVKCAAPSGYLSTQRAVCREMGPQDAEQFVFGSLAFGFNHLGHILLRAPSPVLHCSSHGDFFPFTGVLDTAALARKAYATFGASPAYALSDTTGSHAWHESTSSYAVDWMDHWLQGAPLTKTMADYRALQYGFSFKDVDTGLSNNAGSPKELYGKHWEASVTPTGRTLDLAGERTVYDILAEEAVRQKAARKPLTPAIVQKVAGIRAVEKIGFTRVRADLLVMDDGTPVPLEGKAAQDGATVLFVSDGVAKEAAPVGAVKADVRGWGATSGSRHAYYTRTSEEIGRLYALVGVNLVAKRAEDILAVAKALGGHVKLVASGAAAIPAAHAYYTGRNLFSALEIKNAPHSWQQLFDDDAIWPLFADGVFGAWAYYDWTDLTK